MKAFIKAFLKFTSIIIVLFVVIVIVINTSPFDEELNPEIIKIMHDVPMPMVEDNAYYAIMGLSAQPNKNIVKTGQEIIARYLDINENGYDGIASDAYDKILGQEMIDVSEWEIEFDSCGHKPEMNCLANFSEKLISQNLDNKSLQVMLNRYSDIIQMTNFTHFSKINFNTPRIKIGYLYKLSQIKLAMSYRPKFRSEFILHLHNDMKFWKMLLNKEAFLIDKLIALVQVRKDIMYLSEYIRNNEITESDHRHINKMLTPLNSKELSFNKNFIAESRAFFNFSNKIEKFNTWFRSLIYQPNATKNTYYENNLKKQIRMSNLPLENLIFEYQSNKNTPNVQYKFHYLYNLIGKTLVNFMNRKTTDYIVRGHDLNNTITMVKIQYQSKTKDHETLQQLLSLPNNANRYNNMPFEFNNRTKQLHFTCLYRSIKCYIQL